MQCFSEQLNRVRELPAERAGGMAGNTSPRAKARDVGLSVRGHYVRVGTTVGRFDGRCCGQGLAL